MTSLLPVAVYGLEVPADDIPIPAATDFPATFRITMAAIDPSAPPSDTNATPRATLKILREPIENEDEDDDDDDDDGDDDDDDIDAIEARLGYTGSDEDEDSEESSADDDDEKNGGPSDPTKSKKARKEAALKQLMASLKDDEDEDMEDAPNGVNGAKKNKGKARALDDEDVDSDDDDESDGMEIEEFVVCTLDPEKNYQQPLDITVAEDERVYFKVSGTHSIFLTGNYLYLPEPHDHDHDEYDSEDDEDYDLSPDEDELSMDDEEEDELDDMADPRITEVDADEEEAPKLIEAKKKGTKKRAAESDEDLDEMISKSKKAEASTNGEQKLSKKQAKKLKNNEGQAVAAAAQDKPAKKEAKETPAKEEMEAKEEKKKETAKSDKKVKFARELEQGPTGSPKTDDKKIRVVQGVTIDDRKEGQGRVAKKGDKIGMRYIGKLQKDGKVFDSNKKGKPFTFTLGIGDVIKGWDIGVAGMTVGSERRITIPPNLAYGSKKLPGIPANSTLVFDVKLLSIN